MPLKKSKITKAEILKKYGRRIQGVGVNLNCVTQKDLLGIINFRCEHKHSFLTHPNCYRNSADNKVERVGAFDIETSNLHADFGIILSWCIKDIDTGKVYEDALSLKDVHNDIFDKRVVASCVETIKSFDRIVTQFGTYFDLPFIRTRALHWDILFPEYGSTYQTDIWKIAKRKLRLHSNRQGSIAETILKQDIKTRIHPKIWVAIQFGSDKTRLEAIKYVIDHNRKDVSQLSQIYSKIRMFVHEGKTSI